MLHTLSILLCKGDMKWDKCVRGAAIKGVSQCDIVEKIALNPNCRLLQPQAHSKTFFFLYFTSFRKL